MEMNVCDMVWAKLTCGGLNSAAARMSCGFVLFFLLFFAATFSAVEAQTSLKYQEPPKAMIDLVDARLTPYVEVSPGDGVSGRWLLIEEISGLPSIADLAQPELRLAGLRFNPKTNGPSRGRYGTGLRQIRDRRQARNFLDKQPPPAHSIPGRNFHIRREPRVHQIDHRLWRLLILETGLRLDSRKRRREKQ